MNEHDRLRTDIGAYLVGSLSPAEHTALERHLNTCADCRAEVAALAALPGLLGRLDADEARGLTLAPGPDLLDRTLAGVRAAQHAQQRRLRRWRLAAVGAAAAAVLTVAAAVLPPATPTATPAPVALSAVAGVTATGSGALASRPWGTAVELDLTGLPAGPGYTAYALARDGHSEIAATWGATPDGHAHLTGATAIPRAELTAVQIRATDQQPLLTLPG